MAGPLDEGQQGVPLLVQRGHALLLSSLTIVAILGRGRDRGVLVHPL